MSTHPAPRNELWDALEAVFGYRPRLPQECKLWGRICKDLREGGATPAEVLAAARAWPRLFPGATLTPTALVKHFSALLAPQPAQMTPARLTLLRAHEAAREEAQG